MYIYIYIFKEVSGGVAAKSLRIVFVLCVIAFNFWIIKVLLCLIDFFVQWEVNTGDATFAFSDAFCTFLKRAANARDETCVLRRYTDIYIARSTPAGKISPGETSTDDS